MGWPRRKFYEWPKDAGVLRPNEIIQMYESGFAGAFDNPAAMEQLKSSYNCDGEGIAHANGFAGASAGKLVIPFVFEMEMFPGLYPGCAQEIGDCVSHSEMKALRASLVGDIVTGTPDEKTGKVEGVPEVSNAGIKDGVFSTEAIYWYRGYNGDGWDCPTAAKVATSKSGLVIKKDYPEMGVDLTTYSGNKAHKYGSNRPPASVQAITSQHPAYDITMVEEVEALADFLAQGYGCSTCGSEGFENKRDANGFSRRTTSWAHAMPYPAVDLRDVIKQLYGEPLVLVNNNWGAWNSGPRDIYQSASYVPPGKKDLWIQLGIVNPQTGNIMIPIGSFWAKWSSIKNREVMVHSGVNGFPARALPNLGTFVW